MQRFANILLLPVVCGAVSDPNCGRSGRLAVHLREKDVIGGRLTKNTLFAIVGKDVQFYYLLILSGA